MIFPVRSRSRSFCTVRLQLALVTCGMQQRHFCLAKSRQRNSCKSVCTSVVGQHLTLNRARKSWWTWSPNSFTQTTATTTCLTSTSRRTSNHCCCRGSLAFTLYSRLAMAIAAACHISSRLVGDALRSTSAISRSTRLGRLLTTAPRARTRARYFWVQACVARVNRRWRTGVLEQSVSLARTRRSMYHPHWALLPIQCIPLCIVLEQIHGHRWSCNAV
mmetsp:Transcript_37063/g.103108  ORF Transcript_37063/g.103108 Transcript_37063/m.103108 type:complete len:218 (+) Transcript_37063:410-1063(+)